MNYELNNKRVLLTGAARGIGREIALHFSKNGARLVLADRDKTGLMETTALCSEQAHAFVCDISDEKDVLDLMRFTQEQLGGLDVVVNDAAVAPHTALLQESVSVWDKVYAVNCRGTFLITRESARLIIKSGGPVRRIILFSSGAAQRGGAGSAAYASSRAAVEGFARCAAIELAPYDILVNTVSPGLIDTQVKPLPEHMAASLGARVPTLPMARAGEAGEVAELVMFLSSPASSYITGSVYSVDGAAGIGSRSTQQIIDDDVRYDWVTGAVRT